MTAAIKLCLVVSEPRGNIAITDRTAVCWGLSTGQGRLASSSTAHLAPADQPRPPSKGVCQGCAGVQAGTHQCSCHARTEESPEKSQEAPTTGTHLHS